MKLLARISAILLTTSLALPAIGAPALNIAGKYELATDCICLESETGTACDDKPQAVHAFYLSNLSDTRNSGSAQTADVVTLANGTTATVPMRLYRHADSRLEFKVRDTDLLRYKISAVGDGYKIETTNVSLAQPKLNTKLVIPADLNVRRGPSDGHVISTLVDSRTLDHTDVEYGSFTGSSAGPGRGSFRGTSTTGRYFHISKDSTDTISVSTIYSMRSTTTSNYHQTTCVLRRL